LELFSVPVTTKMPKGNCATTGGGRALKCMKARVVKALDSTEGLAVEDGFAVTVAAAPIAHAGMLVTVALSAQMVEVRGDAARISLPEPPAVEMRGNQPQAPVDAAGDGITTPVVVAVALDSDESSEMPPMQST
jgi:hypothetical protein